MDCCKERGAGREDRHRPGDRGAPDQREQKKCVVGARGHLLAGGLG